ncbi:nSTAND1 domain-containing NTPase [Tolypothrix sp. VBCCA 56010]|uniref:nSTAND1 domain-containing NTPase n=1 Tax=Tolypothrix sp. VBCCA 56010 TaxID=3137731 RepID=UPI003D7CD41B
MDFWQQSHDVYRQGVLFLYLGLAHYRRGKENWQESRNSIQQGLDIFEQSQRLDLVAKHIGKLSQILRDLEAWDAVYILAQKALRLHETHGELTQLAHDYGLLAEVALKNCRWDEANQRAQQALKFLDDNPQFSSPNIGLYYWILAQSQQQLGEIQNAISNLEKAKEKTQPQGNPTFYLNILDELRSLYFSQGQYLTAFKLKLEQREIKSKYGLQAFIGAARLQPTFQGSNLSQITAEQQAEIAEMIAKASGRQKDVKELLERIKQPKHKLTVIYGPSGVGKSSLLQAGLVPALQLTSFEGWEYFPVLMQVYTDWMETVSNQLSQALNQPINQLSNIQVLTEQLRSMEKHRMYVVLIFDQFEQFFCDNEQPASRRELYDFLRLCLEGIPYLKVILSLREDYLYHLLHFKRTTTLTKVDINNEDILYYLGNFSEEEAKEVIHSLTERSKFHLEDDLVNAVVQDLGRELGEIRPIELQVVGAQLEAEKITQWAEYDKKGPKEKLVERYLEAVVADCGSEKSENRQIAWKILSLLIDNDQDTRPLRTEKELATLLQLRVEQLKFILDIFAGSGLVFFFKGSLGGHYQLIHDYLVKPIRKKKELDYVNFMTAAEQENIRIKEQQKRSLKRTIIAVIVLILGFGFGMEYRRAELEKCQKNSLIHQPTLKPDSLKR